MFTIERLNESCESWDDWIPELEFRTEFKAFVTARTKCMATGRVYRVVNALDEKVECVITLEKCKKDFDLR